MLGAALWCHLSCALFVTVDKGDCTTTLCNQLWSVVPSMNDYLEDPTVLSGQEAYILDNNKFNVEDFQKRSFYSQINGITYKPGAVS